MKKMNYAGYIRINRLTDTRENFKAYLIATNPIVANLPSDCIDQHVSRLYGIRFTV